MLTVMMLLALSMGLAVAVQGPTNGALGKDIGVFQASFVSFFGGFLILLAINLVHFASTGATDLLRVFECEPWELLGGPYGVFLVFCAALCSPRLGAALSLTLQMVGQILASFAVDTWGLFGAERLAISPLRVVGLALVFVGIALVYKGKAAQAHGEGRALPAKMFHYMALMFGSGIVAAIQLPTNVAIRSHFSNVFEPILIHFALGSAVILVVLLVKQKGHIASMRHISPWKFLGGAYGAFGVTTTIYSVPVLGVALNSAANLSGLLIGSLFVDAFGWFGIPKSQMNRWRILGSACLLASVLLISLASA